VIWHVVEGQCSGEDSDVADYIGDEEVDVLVSKRDISQRYFGAISKRTHSYGALLMSGKTYQISRSSVS